MGLINMRFVTLLFCQVVLLLGCNFKSGSKSITPKRYLYFSSQFPEKSFHWYIEVNYKATRDIFFCKTITEASFQPDPRNKTVSFTMDSSGGPLKIPLFQHGLLDCDWKLTFVDIHKTIEGQNQSLLWLTHDTTDTPLRDTLQFNCTLDKWNDLTNCDKTPENHDYGFAFKDSTSSVNLFLSVKLKEQRHE